MKRIIRLFEGYYHLQALYVIAQMIDKNEMEFTSPGTLLIDYDTGCPLEEPETFEVGYALEETVPAREEEYSIRDELALVAHLMRGGQYSKDELACMEDRATRIYNVFMELGLDVSEEFPQAFELDELHAERLRRKNLLN